MRQGLAFATILLLGMAIGAASLLGWNQRAPAQPVVISTAVPTPAAAPSATAAPLQVYVNGAVLHADVYVLPPGSRIKQAIEAAGGFTADADSTPINLAQPLNDGMYIYVSTIGETPPPSVPDPAAPAPVSRGLSAPGAAPLININVATAQELEALPGIGPSLAQRIVAHREAHGPFLSVEAILDVPGIGEAKLQAIRDLVVTGN